MGGVVAGAIFLLTFFSPLSKDEPKPLPPSQKITETNSLHPTSYNPQPIIHTVAPGDTLYSIARDYYGSANFWTTLWNDNPWIEDPRIIKAGMELNIRDKWPEESEKLNEKLAAIYEEITTPSPTLTFEPTEPAVAGASTSQAPTQPPAPAGSFDNVYQEAGAKYGVPWEILYGLHIMETGGRDGAISSGYGTGAQGPLQFMPGTWATYGVDGNGDGISDINNATDAIHGAANYLATHGGVEQGLRSYGGDTQTALNYARSRGYTQ